MASHWMGQDAGAMSSALTMRTAVEITSKHVELVGFVFIAYRNKKDLHVLLY